VVETPSSVCSLFLFAFPAGGLRRTVPNRVLSSRELLVTILKKVWLLVDMGREKWVFLSLGFPLLEQDLKGRKRSPSPEMRWVPETSPLRLIWAPCSHRVEPKEGGSETAPVASPGALALRILPIKLIDGAPCLGEVFWLSVRASFRTARALKGLKNGLDEKIDSVQ
jgi:hypothetical protein